MRSVLPSVRVCMRRERRAQRPRAQQEVAVRSRSACTDIGCGARGRAPPAALLHRVAERLSFCARRARPRTSPQPALSEAIRKLEAELGRAAARALDAARGAHAGRRDAAARGARRGRRLRRRARAGPGSGARARRPSARRLRGRGCGRAQQPRPRALLAPLPARARASRGASSGAARSRRCAQASATWRSSGCPPTRPGWCMEIVAQEDRFAGLCVGHPLAARAELSVVELNAEPILWTSTRAALLGRLVGGQPAARRLRAGVGTGERQRGGDARARRRRRRLLHRAPLDDRVLSPPGPDLGADRRHRSAAHRPRPPRQRPLPARRGVRRGRARARRNSTRAGGSRRGR